VIVIAKGKLVAQGTTEEIQKKRRPRGIEIVVRGDGKRAKEALEKLDGIAKVKIDEHGELARVRGTWHKKLDGDAVATGTEKAVALVVAAGESVREVRPIGSSLEEVFAELTRGHAHGDDDAEDAA
jgi:ABC-type multidrug transport system ATPase subunit